MMTKESQLVQTKEQREVLISQSQTSNYRSIFKNTSLFGGVQLYQILIHIIKSKFIAVLLGPVGVGILGLFQTSLEFIKQISSLGLSQSAVRDVSEAAGEGDSLKISRVIHVVKKLVWITGLTGMLIVGVLSPLLSKLSFGNYDFTGSFIILSVTLLFDQISSGQKVILQGTRRLKDLARASSIGVTMGLVVSVPLYYLFGIKGIVPTLILQSISSLLLSWYFSRKIKLVRIQISTKEAIKDGVSMMKMGLAMCISGFEVSLISYVTRGYINYLSGTEYVGFYTAGVMIIGTYFGMAFSALGTDYYPRLAGVNKDNEKCGVVVNNQGEIASLILCPLLLICLVYMPIIINLLYSDKFIQAADYVIIASFGMMFRLGAWLVSLQFVAKGESKLFIINESISAVYSLALHLALYKIMGLKGIGLSFVVGYLIYFIQVYCISYKRYHFRFSERFMRIFLFQILLCAAGLIVIYFFKGLQKYLIGSILIVVSLVYSLVLLNKRTDIVFILFKKNIKKHENNRELS